MPNTQEKLTKYVKDQQQMFERERELKKPSPNQRMAESAADTVDSYDFWCATCCEDFTSSAYKTWHRLYGDAIATYRAYHEDCGEECIRYITHRDQDPFYWLSERVNAQRNEYEVDVLHHEQYGFRTHWGEPFKEYYARLKKGEEKIIMGEREKGFGGFSLKAQERLHKIHHGN